jgi:hypothetical protein
MPGVNGKPILTSAVILLFPYFFGSTKRTVSLLSSAIFIYENNYVITGAVLKLQKIL